MRLKICQLISGLFFATLCVALFGISFWAALSYGGDSNMSTWYACLSAAAFLTGGATAVGAGIGFTAFFIDLCDAAQRADNRAYLRSSSSD